MIEIKKFKLSVFNVKLIFSSFLLFFFKSSSKFLNVSSESIAFSLSCYCCNILSNIWWKFNVVSKIKKFLDRMKALSNKKFVSKTLQAWFISINKEILAAFWLSESAYLSQMIKNVSCSVSKFIKSLINSKNSSLLLSLSSRFSQSFSHFSWIIWKKTESQASCCNTAFI